MKKYMHVSLLIFLILGMGFALPGGQERAQAQSSFPPELFEDVYGDEVTAQGQVDATTLRARTTGVKLAAVEAVRAALVAGQTQDTRLTLLLFSDARYLAQFTAVTPSITGGYILSGHLEGEPQSEVYLSVQDGVISAHINLYDAIYRVQYDPGGTYRIRQLNAGGYPPDLEITPPSPAPDDEAQVAVNAQAGGAVADDGSLIDVMIIYTPDTVTRLGGEAATQAAINQSVALANQAYRNSEINQQIRLVHAQQINYKEDDKGDIAAILKKLRTLNDGVMDEVGVLRDTYNADLVTLLVGKEYVYCGISAILGHNANGAAFAPYGYNVVDSFCLEANMLSHELGHNMGGAHERELGHGPGLYPYSYGYQNLDTLVYTIMAYGNHCDEVSGYNCTQINYFSHPTLLYKGGPIGTVNDDNHRTFNESRTVVANFRNGAEPPTPGLTASGGTVYKEVRLAWNDASDLEAGFFIERSPAGLNQWEQLSTTQPNVTGYSDENVVCLTDYDYRVTALSANGNSAPSNIATVSSSVCAPDAPAGLQTAFSFLDPTILIDLDWTDRSSDEGGFRVERKTASEAWSVVSDTVAANSVHYQDVLGESGCSRTFDYRVIAYNALGDSFASNTASARTVLCRPGEVKVVIPHALSQSKLNVSWTDASPDESGFRLERSLDKAVWTPVASLAAGTVSFADQGLACGTRYYYRLQAYDSAAPVYDSGYSLVDDVGAGTALTGSCAPPQMSIAPLMASRVGRTGIRICWNDIEDETGFNVYRSLDGVDWSLAGSTGANATCFLDQGLTPDTLYHYRTLPFNAYGSPTPLAENELTAQTHRYAFWTPIFR